MKKNQTNFFQLLFAGLCLAYFFSGAVCLADVYQPLVDPATSPEIKTQDDAFLSAAGFGTEPVTIGDFVAVIIYILLSFLGIIFICLIIYAGLLWMTSAGNEEKVKKSKDIMVAAVIGLTIVIMAYAITTFVINNVLEVMQGGSEGTHEVTG